MTKNNTSRVGSEAQYDPRPVGEILNEFLENSDAPLAVAYRERLFKDLFPNTEPCVDLKLLTRKPGSLNIGDSLPGSIIHDDERHFTFLQEVQEKKPSMIHRNPRVFKGEYINIVRMEDGTMRPTFRYPRYKDGFTFQDFCIAAAKELIAVSGLGER